VALVFLAISAYVNGVLGRFRKISPAEAVRFGVSQENGGGGRRFRLSMNKLLGTNVFLGVKDVLARSSLYATMLIVLVLAAFIIIVPQNLHNTIPPAVSSPTWGLAIATCALTFSRPTRSPQKRRTIAAALERDSDIAKFVVLTTQTFSARLEDGTEARIKVELGDHSVFPLTYAAGRAPVAENELALSVMQANEMGKKVGDVVTLIINGRETAVTVCGTYSDVTNGGKTAKAVFTDDSAGHHVERHQRRTDRPIPAG
jgi:putative ABC transport system permease protein